MDTHYQSMYTQAASLQHRVQDYTRAAAYDPTANVLRQQMHGLTHDLAANRNPRLIDNRVRTIQTQLRRQQMMNPGMGMQNPILNNSQRNFLHSNLEQIRQNAVRHPNF